MASSDTVVDPNATQQLIPAAAPVEPQNETGAVADDKTLKNKKKKSTSKRHPADVDYVTYIRKLVHDETKCRITRAAVSALRGFANDLVRRVAEHASRLMQLKGVSTVGSVEVEYAVRTLFLQVELDHKLVAAGRQAAKRYHANTCKPIDDDDKEGEGKDKAEEENRKRVAAAESTEREAKKQKPNEETGAPVATAAASEAPVEKKKKKKGITKTQSAGLVISVARVRRDLEATKCAERMGELAPVYLAAVVQCALEIILAVVAEIATKCKRVKITTSMVAQACAESTLVRILMDNAVVYGGKLYAQPEKKQKKSTKKAEATIVDDDDAEEDEDHQAQNEKDSIVDDD